jgi:phosphoglycerol transferase MdoB-like AlkP superfamily enzyme
LIVMLVIAGWVGSARGAEPRFRLVSHRTPATIHLGLPAEAELVLENTGDAIWSDEAGDRLAYHWRDPTGALLVRDGVRTRLPGPVAPGERVVLRARIEAPDRLGPHRLEWRMVRENVAWYPRPDDGEPTSIDVEVAGPAFTWTLAAFEPPAELSAGDPARARVVIRNDGAATWSAEQGDAVSYRWWTADGAAVPREGRRTALPRPLAPGERMDLELAVDAPSRPGCYRLEVEPVREHVSWFGAPLAGAALSGPLWVEPGPLAWDLLDHDTPSTMSAGVGVDVTVSIANVGDEAWDERDALSYRWLDERGRWIGEGPRVRIDPPLEPGASATVGVRVQAPREPGRHRLAWEVVREHVRWLGPPSGPLPEPALVTVGPAPRAWSLLEIDELPAIWVGQDALVRVVIRNDGTDTWSDELGDHVSYHWLSPDGEMAVFDGRRTGLPGPVAPGAAVELALRITGPRMAGEYRLEVEMVREEVAWYGPAASSVLPEGGIPVRVRWFSGMLQILASLAALAVIVVARRRVGTAVGWVAMCLPELPIVWTWAAIALTAVSFAELSGVGFWSGALGVTLSGAALASLAVALTPVRWRAGVSGVLVGAAGALVLADLAYMHFYGGIVPVTALTAAHHLGEVGASVRALFQPSWWWLAPTLATGLAWSLAWPSRALRERAVSSGRSHRIAVALALVATLPAAIRLADVATAELGRRVFSEQHNAARLGVFNAHLFDVIRSVRDLGRGAASPEERLSLRAWFADRAAAVARAAQAVPGHGAARGHNLVLLQVESAQGFVIGAHVDGQPITPFLDTLHQRGVYFSNVVDQTAEGKTSDAEYAVLSSQHPLRAGALCFLRARNRFYTLAHVLAERGYTTLSAHPFKRGFWNRAVIHPRYGFERSLFDREIGAGSEVGWGLADGPFLERMSDEIDALPRPFFAFLITLSLHHPYEEFPAALQELDLGALQGTPLGNYLHAMNYFDRELERFFDRLERSGRLDDTVVAVFGDHDARLEPDADFLRVAGIEHWSPSLPLRLERIPFFVVLPGSEPHGEVGAVGGHVDVAPTLLHFLGIPRPVAFVGRPIGAQGAIAAHPTGSAVAHDRYFVADGADLPAEGGCFDAARGTSRPRRDCDEIAAAAAEELARSRAVLDHDLHRDLGD